MGNAFQSLTWFRVFSVKSSVRVDIGLFPKKPGLTAKRRWPAKSETTAISWDVSAVIYPDEVLEVR